MSTADITADGREHVLPPVLPELVSTYMAERPQPVRFRPASWQKVIGDQATGWLTGDVSQPIPAAADQPSPTAEDRLLDAGHLEDRISGVRLEDDQELRRAFVAVMAWGSGTSAPRSYRHTATALHDTRLVAALRDTSVLCRQGDLDSLEEAYRRWRVAGVRRSFFTKWFRFAGRVEGREWQPLILDDRVLATLNRTLGISTIQLADGHTWPRRYRAYVEALHSWSRQLPTADSVPVGAGRLEWILFRHNGEPDVHCVMPR